MTWDFAEGNPFSSASGNFNGNVGWVLKAIERFSPAAIGVERQHDAQTVDFPEGTVISTDPPYYDNIGYADLSDFFFSWLKPSLKSVFPSIFEILATPKSEELVATPYRHGGKEAAETFFLDGMRSAIANMAQKSSDDVPALSTTRSNKARSKTKGSARPVGRRSCRLSSKLAMLSLARGLCVQKWPTA